jgi:hypothetical protein
VSTGRFARAAAIVATLASIGLAGSSLADPLSLLVVGDAGEPPASGRRYRTQLAVADAMAASDAAAPIHGIVLVGDLFYPDGLRAHEEVARVRANLARPYGRFLRFDGPAAAEVESACEAPPAQRRPVPFFAALGNHDHGDPTSPARQRAITARYFSNWQMSYAPAAVHELPGGVSLVVFDSTPIFDGGDATALENALRNARGPWRILAGHHPIASHARPWEEGVQARFRKAVTDAVSASGVTVHLMLAGHEHNLQLLAMDAPAPRLHAISGGGSGARSLRGDDPRRLAGAAEPGFVRIDLIGEDDAPERARLAVTLYGLPGVASRLAGGGPRPLARRTVDLAGRVGE